MSDAKMDVRRDIVKQAYRPVLLLSTALSTLLVLGFYWANMPLERTRQVHQKQAEIIEVVEIPPTAQQEQQAAPARPQVPIEAEDEMEIEELTIEDTDLYEQAELPVPEKIQDHVVEVEEPPMEFWMVEEKPDIVTQAVPLYPEIARQAGMEGDVIVEMVLGTDGRVESVRILRGPPVFHEEAKKAAMRMVFTPARQNDRPVRIKISQRISFRLRG